jgi:hypothetical protein
LWLVRSTRHSCVSPSAVRVQELNAAGPVGPWRQAIHAYDAGPADHEPAWEPRILEPAHENGSR